MLRDDKYMGVTKLGEDSFILEWFETTSIKESTREKYIEAMKEFLALTKKTPEELILEAESEIKSGKLMRERHVKIHLLRYKSFLGERVKNGELAASTVAMRISAIKSFYMSFEIDLPKNLLNGDALPKVENINLRFGKEDIKKMLMHCSKVRDRAIILAMKSSGMARQEIINFKYEQFREGYDSSTKIATLYIRRKKVGYDYTTFIDTEGTEVIMEYLKKDGRLTDNGCLDNKFDSMPLFTTYRKNPTKISEMEFMYIFRTIAIRMKEYKSSKIGTPIRYNPVRSHNLRKFFRTTLLHDGMDDTLINQMMGHIPSRVSKAYFIDDVERLREQYMKHKDALTIYSAVTNRNLSDENIRLRAKLEKFKAHDMTDRENMLSLLDDFKRTIENN